MSQTALKNHRNTLRIAAVFGVVAALGGVAVTFAAAGTERPAAPPKKKAPAKPAPKAAVPTTTQTGFTDNTPLTEEQKIVHALNRLGFGPRPGDVDRVKAMGLSAYIDRQLNAPVGGDPAVEAKLAPFPILAQSNAELATAYYTNLRAGVEAKQLQGKIAERMQGSGQEMMSPEEMAESPEKRAENMRKMYAAATPEEREKLQAMRKNRQKEGRKDGIQDASRALQVAKVVRATESENQLHEVMSDFWGNHFNIDIRKNQCRVLKVADEREVIRKNALGSFRDLLGASAHSPAMMVYLDNASNVAPQPDNPRREKMRQAYMDRMAKEGDPLTQAVVASKRGKQGINENYAREIMELHTLGVDGGYTQKDVQEVARCLTGWGVGNPRNGGRGEWAFNAKSHDNGEKTVLGVTIPANGGAADGEKVLDLLASHPATMKYVSTKLCKRFVADEPPASLVNKCVATWQRTDGNIREIVRTIVTSPEFYGRAAYRQKIKSPFEYAVSSVRAVGGTFDLSRGGLQNTKLALNKGGGLGSTALNRTLAGQVTTMGQPLYQHQAPTGYPEDSRKWVSSGALVSRLNFALGLMRGDLIEVRIPTRTTASGTDSASIVNTVTNEILNGDVSPATRATLLKQANAAVSEDSAVSGQSLEQRLTALVLGSPEFQRR